MKIPKHIKEEIDKLVESYPKRIIASPRGAFEEQLKEHLVNYYKKRYGVKE